MNKKIMILYISNISGHKSAAMAIERAIVSLAPRVDLIGMNFFNYVFPIIEKVVNSMYMGVIKTAPIVWQVMYDNPRVIKSTSRIRKFVYKQVEKKVNKLMQRHNPDVVITTQAFPCEILSTYKRKSGHNFKLFAVLTDYVPHSFWISPEVDFYVVASDDVRDKMLKKGVEPEKIKVLGIPIDPCFAIPKPKSKIKKQLKLPEGMPVVLVMGGGQGIGPFKNVMKEIDKLDEDFAVISVCGTNKRLFRSLKRLSPKLRHTLINYAYVENIDELMEASNVIITKAGGLTISEAMAKGLPMIIMNSLPGQEYNNLRFLLKHRIALRAEDGKEAAVRLNKLLTDKRFWQKLHTNALRLARPNSSLGLAHLVLEI